MYLVKYKSSGIVAARFTVRADAVSWVQQNDNIPETYSLDEDGYKYVETVMDAGMYEIVKDKA